MACFNSAGDAVLKPSTCSRFFTKPDAIFSEEVRGRDRERETHTGRKEGRKERCKGRVRRGKRQTLELDR